MISISKPLTVAQLKTYHEEEYTQGDYYLGTTEAPVAGVWSGKGAERLGLSGGVAKADYLHLVEGQAPDGRQIVRYRHSKAQKDKGALDHRAGYDATASAPKSFSIIALGGGDHRLLDAHSKANQAALEVLEWAAEVRAGADRNQVLRTGELVVASFVHRESRALDPALHTHNVIFNVTWAHHVNGGRGDWRALHPRGLYRAQTMASAAYRNVMVREGKRHGYDIYFDDKGAPQIVGLDQKVLDAFSARREEIERELAQAEQRATAQGRVLTPNDRAKIAEWAAHKTRTKKQKGVDGLLLAESWYLKAAELGVDLRGLIETSYAHSLEPTPERLAEQQTEKAAAVQEAVDLAVEHLTSRLSIVKQSEVVLHALEQREHAGKFDPQDVLAELDRQVAEGILVRREHDGEMRYTTAHLQQLEREMLSMVERGQGKVAPIGNAWSIAEAQVLVDEQGRKLNDNQQLVFAFLAASEDQFLSVHGVAGSGKSFTLKKFAEFAEKEGYVVRAFAPTHAAVAELRKEGLPASTVQSHLPSRSWSGPTGSETGFRQEIWLVDEAGMLGLEDMHGLLAKARTEFARVVLVGDKRQYGSVPNGRAYSQLLDGPIGNIELALTTRQNKATEIVREAVRTFARNDVKGAMEMLRQDGRVIVEPDVEVAQGKFDDSQRYARVAELYLGYSGDVLVVTATNEERKKTNLAIREKLIERGDVAPDGFETTIFANQNVTAAEKKMAESYLPGSMIKFIRVRHEHLVPNEWYRVTGQDVAKGLVTVEDAQGRSVTYRPKEHHDITDIHRVVERVFAPGDKVGFKAGAAEYGIKAGQSGTIVAVDPAGRALVETKDGDLLVDLAAYKSVDYGYVSTGHSSQGRTVDASIVLATSFHRIEVVNQMSAYVGGSRPRYDVWFVVDDYDAAVKAMDRLYKKEAALDLDRESEPHEEQALDEKERLIRDILGYRQGLHDMGLGPEIRSPEGLTRHLLGRDVETLTREHDQLKERFQAAEANHERQRLGSLKLDVEGETQAVPYRLEQEAETIWARLPAGDREPWVALAASRFEDIEAKRKQYGEAVVRDALAARAERLFSDDFVARKTAGNDSLPIEKEIAETLAQARLRERGGDFVEPGQPPSGLSPEALRERETLGQELKLKLLGRHLTHLKTELVEQANLRRYSVLTETAVREQSRFDVELRAKVRARLAGDGTPRNEREAAVANRLQTEREQSQPILLAVDAAYAKQLGRVSGEIRKTEAALHSATEMAERVRCAAAERASDVPEVYLDRASLDRLHEEAVRRGDSATVELLAAIRERQAGEFGQPEHTAHSAGRLTAQATLAGVELRLAEQRLAAFEAGLRLRPWKTPIGERSLGQIEKEMDHLAQERLLVAARNRIGGSPETTTRLAELTAETDRLAGAKAEIEEQIGTQRWELQAGVRSAATMHERLQALVSRFPHAPAPWYHGHELAQLERAAMTLRDTELLGEYEVALHQFRERENPVRKAFTRIHETDLAARSEARTVMAEVDARMTGRAVENFEKFHGAEPDFVDLPPHLSEGMAAVLRDRQTVGQETVLRWQLRDTELSLQALGTQELLRRYVTQDGRTLSSFDLERKARTEARAEAAAQGLTGAERAEFVAASITARLAAETELQAELSQGYLEAAIRLEARVERLEQKLQAAIGQTAGLQAARTALGFEPLEPIVSRKSLDALQAAAVGHQDVEFLAEVTAMRTRMAAESGQPEFTLAGMERSLAQRRVSEVDAQLSAQRLADFTAGNRFWSFQVEGEEWSLAQLETTLRQQEKIARHQGIRLAGLQQTLRVVADSGRAVLEAEMERTAATLREVHAAATRLETVREQVLLRIDETRQELEQSARLDQALHQALEQLTAGFPAELTPRYEGHELARLETAAQALASPELLAEYESESTRFAWAENAIRRDYSRIAETDLAARSSARTEMADLEVEKAETARNRYEAWQGRSAEFFDAGKLSASEWEPLREREVLGREWALKLVLQDLEQAQASLLEQTEFRRFNLENEAVDRESSRFDLEQRAKNRAKAEAAAKGLKGEEKRAYITLRLGQELARHESTFGVIDQSLREQIWHLDARLQETARELAATVQEADRIRSSHDLSGLPVPESYVSRKTLDALAERSLGRKDLSTLGEIETVRDRLATEFGSERHVRESAGRLAASERMAELDTRLAEKRLADFENGKAFWTWRVGDRDVSLQEVNHLLDGTERAIKGLEKGREAFTASLKRTWDGEEKAYYRTRLELYAANHRERLQDLEELQAIRQEVEGRIAETRLELTAEVDRHRAFHQEVAALAAGTGWKTEPDYTGREVTVLEQTAATLKDPALLTEFEAAAERFVSQENDRRTPVTWIDHEDLAARAEARVTLAELDVSRATNALAQFQTYRDRTRQTLEDGSRANLVQFTPRTLAERFGRHYVEARDGREAATEETTLRNRLELGAAAKAADVVAEWKNRLAETESLAGRLALKAVEQVERAVAESPEQVSRRREVEALLQQQEATLKTQLKQARAYHEETLANRSQHRQELLSSGAAIPSPLFTTREAVRLENEGIRRNDPTLEQQGIAAAETARLLKDEFGSAHPLTRRAEYETRKSYEARLELKPVDIEANRLRLEQKVTVAHTFKAAAVEYQEGHEALQETKGVPLPEPLHTAREAQAMEAFALATRNEALAEKAQQAAERAGAIKQEYGDAHPLARRAEYATPPPGRAFVEYEPVDRELERRRLTTARTAAERMQETETAIRDDYRTVTEAKPLFTAREAIRLEMEGIRTQDAGLEQQGIAAAVQAEKLKRENGNAHPLIRTAEYETRALAKTVLDRDRRMDIKPEAPQAQDRSQMLASAWKMRELEQSLGLPHQASSTRLAQVYGRKWDFHPDQCLAEAEHAYRKHEDAHPGEKPSAKGNPAKTQSVEVAKQPAERPEISPEGEGMEI